MHALQIYAPTSVIIEVTRLLREAPGVNHVVRVGPTEAGGLILLNADVETGFVDSLLPRLAALGVDGDEISIIRQEADRPLGTPRAGDQPSWSGGPLAWTELTLASRQYARAVPQYLTFMAAAGIIAAFGVLTKNTILIVGAMAISPDLLPLCATCVGIADRRPRLAGRAFAALLIGLVVAALTAFVTTALLRAGGYSFASVPVGEGGLGVLPTVNVATVVVALVAGVVGILAFETKSGSAVGVAISVTTIPAAAFIGVVVAVHDWRSTGGAVAVLAVNIVILLTAGTATLLAQRIRR